MRVITHKMSGGVSPPQPSVSTLNAIGDGIVANAAIVSSGAAGSISTFATDQTHLLVDANGYFAP